MNLHLPPEEPDFGPWKVISTQSLVESLQQELPDSTDRPGVVAIDGRSASGKTTLASTKSGNVPKSVVVHTDDIAWHHSFFDWTDVLLNGVLVPAHARREVRFRPPAWEQRDRVGAIEVPAGCPLLIVEGVGAARKELMPLIDVVVWVQSDIERAKTRGITRDGGNAEAIAFWNEWMAEEMPFLAEQRPWERASVIALGTPDLKHDPRSQIVVTAQTQTLR